MKETGQEVNDLEMKVSIRMDNFDTLYWGLIKLLLKVVRKEC